MKVRTSSRKAFSSGVKSRFMGGLPFAWSYTRATVEALDDAYVSVSMGEPLSLRLHLDDEDDAAGGRRRRGRLLAERRFAGRGDQVRAARPDLEGHAVVDLAVFAHAAIERHGAAALGVVVDDDRRRLQLGFVQPSHRQADRAAHPRLAFRLFTATWYFAA